MGYGMSRLEEAYNEHEGQNSDGSSSVEVNNEFSKLHNDIFHMTRLRSGPSEAYPPIPVKKLQNTVSPISFLWGDISRDKQIGFLLHIIHGLKFI